MIYKVSGQLIMKEGGKVAIDCAGGIAYEIFTSMSTFLSLPCEGEQASLYTYQAVREDGIFLYGFLSQEEKSLFLLLNTVSKIGPKSALSILGNIPKDELALAIVSEDVARLSKIPGIGKKTAERIIVELKDKLKIHVAEGKTGAAPNIYNDVLSALCNLGYKSSDCEKALSGVSLDTDFQTVFKTALAKLAG